MAAGKATTPTTNTLCFNCWALDTVPWSANDFYTKDNITSLALRINSTVQTDFWFCKDEFCW